MAGGHIKVLVRGISLWSALLGLVVLSGLSTAPLSTVQAAQLSWGSQSHQIKRPLFRPLTRSAPAAPSSLRWRPTSRMSERTLTSAAAGRGYPVTLDKRMQQPLLTTTRPLRRPSPPISPDGAMGLRFRPDVRHGTTPLLRTGPAQSVASRQHVALHAQFRPQRAGQRKTYEQLQAKSTQKRLSANAVSWPYAPNAYGMYRMPW